MATVTRWDPFAQLEQFQRELDRVFEGRRASLSGSAWLPATDIEQTADAVLYKLDLPGMRAEDVTVQVHNGTLTVSGLREKESEDRHEGYYTRERMVGEFARTYSLPKGTGQGDIQADFADGVLTITVPRSEEEKPRTIEIGESD